DKSRKRGGQQVPGEHRPGPNGFSALGAAKAARADGYTLAQASSAQLAPHPFVYKSLPYDPAKDFEPVTPLFRNHFFVVVGVASPFKSVGELVAAAKRRPGDMTYGSGFIGSPGPPGPAPPGPGPGTRQMPLPFKERAHPCT